MKVLLAGIFGLVVRARGALYDRGWLASDRAELPVISVGNLAVGGTGKTPFTALITAKLIARGERVAILSRGYGAPNPPQPPALVPRDGDARVFSDEPLLLAQKTGAQVIVSPKRILGARLAKEQGATVLVLDDGFQHRALHRDLDLVLLDAADPFAGGLLPKGRLREPPSALERAHLLVLVGNSTTQHLYQRPVLRVEAVPRPTLDLRGRKVALLAAIARPERFRATVEALGATVTWAKFFADHAFFDPQEHIEAARKHGAELILTTEKDHSRTPHSEVLPLPIEHVVTEGEALLDAELDRVLGAPR